MRPHLHQLLLQLLWARILLLQVGHLLCKGLQGLAGMWQAHKLLCHAKESMGYGGGYLSMPSLQAGNAYALSRSASQTRKPSIPNSHSQTPHLAQQEGARRGGGRVRRTPAVCQEQLQQAGCLL